MSKQLAPICRIVQRPVPGSSLGPGTYLTFMQRPGCDYTDLILGERRESLRAAIEVATNRTDYDARKSKK